MMALQEFSGELLALAGPLEPSAISFDPATAFSPTLQTAAGVPSLQAGGVGGVSSSAGRTQSTQTPGAGGGKGGRGGSSRSRASPAGTAGTAAGGLGTWVAALQLLGDYLVDESVEVISTAQETLRLLLATREGQEALAHCDLSLRPYLEAFQGQGGASANGGEGFAAPPAAFAAQPAPRTYLGDSQLWRCDLRPYAVWLCDLACAMLGQVKC